MSRIIPSKTAGRQRINQRIAFDARLLPTLGIGRYVSGLLPALAALLGDRLLVLATARDAARIRALVGSAPALAIANARPYRLAEQSAFLLQLLRARPSLIHFPHYNLPLAYPGRFVVTIHDLFSFQYPKIHAGRLPRSVNQQLIRNAVARAAAIITPSRATASEVGRRFPDALERIVPIPEATDRRFHPGRNVRAESAWTAHFGIRHPYVLYLGQWKAYKNLRVLFLAFEEVLERVPRAQLVIAGADPRHPDVPDAARRLPEGAVVLTGRLPDDAVPELYRGAAAVALPSLAEGFGLPVLEAMACGARVVCSDLPVLREIADGVAIFCDPSDPASFARGIVQALDPPPDDRRPELGLERAQAFSWKKAAEETLRVYERALTR